MLGLNSNFNPKFLKKYADAANETVTAINQYVDEVTQQKFPTKAHSYE
jgi:3-methyl-2-oxobutanoate hydroxymethyltransferase